MAKLQLASSPAAEPLAAAPGNPRGFRESRRHVQFIRKLPGFWFWTRCCCSSSQRRFEAAFRDVQWWSKLWKTCFLARRHTAHEWVGRISIWLYFITKVQPINLFLSIGIENSNPSLRALSESTLSCTVKGLVKMDWIRFYLPYPSSSLL